MDVCLLWELCVVKWSSLRRADHLSKGALPSVVCLSVIVKLENGGGLGPRIKNLFTESHYREVCVCVCLLTPSFLQCTFVILILKKVKWSRYRLGVAQRVGRDIALLFHDRGSRRGWVISSTPRSYFTPGKDPVPILQEAGWAPGPVWTGGKSRPHWDSITDRPARSQSLYRLSYPAHILILSSVLLKK